ncbi:MAG: S41 family peptidase [Chitinophagaceae bacterium]
MKFSFLVFLLFFTAKIKATVDSCDCLSNYRYLRNFITKNYIDYNYYKEIDRLGNFIDSVIGSSPQTAYSCFTNLKDYFNGFNDPHLSVRLLSNPNTFPKIQEIFSKSDSHFLVFDSTLLKNLSVSGIEGEYESIYYNMRIRLIKFRRKYYGIVVRGDNLFWYPNQVKFIIPNSRKLTGEIKYFSKEHSPKAFKYSFGRNVLSIVNADEFIKDTSGSIIPYIKRVGFKNLSDSTTLLSLTDFDISCKSLIDSTVHASSSQIFNKPNLIIDLRGNAGGSSDSYDTLLSIILSSGNYNFPGSRMKATPDNFFNFAKGYSDFNSKYSMDSILKSLKSFKIHKDGTIKISVARSIKFTSYHIYPKHVIIITDGGVISAAETLVDFARQSSKVTIVGENTRGGIDNLNARSLKMPCPIFRVSYPVTQRATISRYKNGIKPDIKLLFSGYQDWVVWAKNYLEKATHESKF